MDLVFIHESLDMLFAQSKINYTICDNLIKYNYNDNEITFIFNNNMLIPYDHNYLANHIYRILIFEKINDLFLIIEKVISLIKKPYIYCTCCGNKLLIPSKKISCCMKDICKYQYESILTDDYVTCQYKKDPGTINFLLETTLCALVGKKRDLCFSPYPYYFSNKNHEYFRDTTKSDTNTLFQNFSKLDSLNLDYNIIIDAIERSMSDLDIVSKLNLEIYAFIKFTIKSNKARIISMNDINIKNISSKEFIYTKNNNIKLFELKYHISIEKQYTPHNSIYLFHGSAKESWHPIMRNGIKNLSNTKLMAHGAAFGPGIYLANSMLTAIGYCHGSPILGVCQVKDYDKYKKSENIYVVHNNDDIIIKYLIYCKELNNCIEAENYFLTLNNKIHLNAIQMNKITNKRMNKEYELIKKKGFNIIKLSYNKWTITLPNSKKIKNIVVNILFENEYPEVPPILYLVSPKFISGDHNVMNKGIILTKNTIYDNWNPKIKLIDILKEIYIGLIKSYKYSIDGSYAFTDSDIIDTYYDITQ